MVPDRLEDWTFDVISTLCSLGQSESERHDFKHEIRGIKDLSKICCAFSNTRGGFIIIGVRENGRKSFLPEGIPPDKELYGNFVGRLQIEPAIDIPLPKIIEVPNSADKIYVFAVPESRNKPHQPTPLNERAFWKRQGSDCERMTLNEVKLQMINTEEKHDNIRFIINEFKHIKNQIHKIISIPKGQYMPLILDLSLVNQSTSNAISIISRNSDIITSISNLRNSIGVIAFEQEKLKLILSGPYSLDIISERIEDLKQYCSSCLNEIDGNIETLASEAERLMDMA